MDDGIPESVLDTVPAMLPPDGQTSNFVNPPSLFAVDLITTYISLFLGLSFFAVRAYTKTFLLKTWYIEDYNCAIATALFSAYCGLLIWGGYEGGGRHQWDTSLAQAMNLVYISTVVETVYCVTMTFSKLAVLQQIRHIFAVTKNGEKGVVYVTTTVLIWMNVLFYVIAAGLFIFSCTPRQAAWDVLIQGKCINTKLLIVASSGINIVSDVSILVVPIACTWKLVLPRKRKIGLAVVFATGGFCCGTSIARLVLAVPLLSQEDVVYILMPIGLTTVAELTTAIMCSCMPCFPRFVRHFRTWTSSHGSSYNSSWPASNRPPLSTSIVQSGNRKSDGGRPWEEGWMIEKPRAHGAHRMDEEAGLEIGVEKPLRVAARYKPLISRYCRLSTVMEECRTPAKMRMSPIVPPVSRASISEESGATTSPASCSEVDSNTGLTKSLPSPRSHVPILLDAVQAKVALARMSGLSNPANPFATPHASPEPKGPPPPPKDPPKYVKPAELEDTSPGGNVPPPKRVSSIGALPKVPKLKRPEPQRSLSLPEK